MGLDTQASPVTRPPEESDVEDFARKILLQRLEAQPRSRAELAESLAKKNVPVEVAERLLDRFEQVGLIDDAAFARMWVDSRVRTRGLARRALAMELRRKGISEAVVREVLDDLDPEAEQQAARRLVQRKLRSMAGLDDTVRIRRLVGMLARKGYSPQVAFDIVRAELDG